MNLLLEHAAVAMNREPTALMADAYDGLDADARLFADARRIIGGMPPGDADTLSKAMRRLAEFGEPDPAHAEALCRIGMASVRRAAGMGVKA